MWNKHISIKRAAASLLMTVSLSLFVASCQRRPQTIKYVSLPEEGWRSDNILTFEVDSMLPSDSYQAYLGIRTSSTVSYPYRQLVLEVTQSWGNQQRIVDTLECEVAEPDGEEKGQGVSLYAMEFPLGPVFVRQDTIGQFSVRHLMRQTPLRGIVDVGIIFRP